MYPLSILEKQKNESEKEKRKEPLGDERSSQILSFSELQQCRFMGVTPADFFRFSEPGVW